MGFVWKPVSPRRDFCGYPFHLFLTLDPPPHPDWRNRILEPDNHVPNYSTNLHDALNVARRVGMEMIPVLATEEMMAAWICSEALASVNTIQGDS
jgi:hypothetical protein